MSEEKRSSIAPLAKRVTRMASIDLPASGTLVGLTGELAVSLIPEEKDHAGKVTRKAGVSLRLKGKKREVFVPIEKLVDIAEGDTVRQKPNNRKYLQGK